MSEFDALPKNPETDPQWNQEPGIAVVPGSHYANYMQKFEQFPSKYGQTPGNPYVYRPFPKMLYKAYRVNGAPVCLGAPPDPLAFDNPGHYQRAEAQARQFSESCQKIVKDEVEMQKAFEMGWREDPPAAIAALIEKDKIVSQHDAHREYEDRNLSDAAKAEVQAIKDARGGEPVPEKERTPVRKPTYVKKYDK